MISIDFTKGANAPRTNELPIALMTVDHETFDEPKRFSTDATVRLSTDPLRYGTVSRGQTYTYLPMSIVLPEDGDEAQPTMQTIISNLTRELMPLIRSVVTPMVVSTDLVLRASPDHVQGSWPEFDLTSASYEKQNVTFGLTVDPMSAEPYPSGQFTPAGFPAVF